MCTIEDQALITKFQAGDREAMDTLIARHQDRMYQQAYRLAGNADDAADIVAEAFIRVYRSAASYRGSSQFGTWLYRVVMNCYLDQRRRNRHQPIFSIDAEIRGGVQTMEAEIVDPATTPQDRIEGVQRSTRLRKAIETLPDGQRSLVYLFHAHELTYEEIAEVANLPLGTVKSRLNRARLSLRSKLDEDQELFNFALRPQRQAMVQAA